MKLAAIDIGTNSTRLLINDYSNDKFFTIERKMEITRLGKDLSNNNSICEDSANRTIKTLSAYSKLIKKHDVKKYRAVGTSVLRKAANGKDFALKVERDLGLKVNIIDEMDEARLSYCGAVRNINLDGNFMNSGKDLKILVIDIGGGSSEFVLGDADCNINFIRSLDIGCVNLSEKFIGSDVADAGQLNKMHLYIKEKANCIVSMAKDYNIGIVIGVAGTITTIAAIDLGLDVYDSKKIDGYVLSMGRVREIYSFICGLSLEEREKIAGISPGRADVIIGGAAIFIEVLNMLNRKNVNVSERDILDGIIYSIADF
jgi:exopolyphosphatase / guanosine-5'-triphosphate,3'-diphosphate pyrophosphatase